MGIFDSIKTKLASFKPVKPRELQETFDLSHACMLTCLRKELYNPDASRQEFRNAAVEKVIQSMEKVSPSKHAEICHNNINAQLVKMFTVIKDARSETSYISSVPVQVPSEAPLHFQDQSVNAFERHQNDLTLEAIKKQMGFSLQVKQSVISGAGKGVFVEGMAEVGDVLALYPGYVYLQQHLAKNNLAENLFPDENYFLYTRYDNIIIDGRSQDLQPYNEFGCAHLVNHPPQGSEPNVLAVAFNFPSKTSGNNCFPQNLRPLIPNTYFKPPTLFGLPDYNILMQSVVFLATRRIHDEELWLNYRFNPKKKLPIWYHQCDEDQAERRWG